MAVTVGSTALLPGARSPGTSRVTTPPADDTDGVPVPRPDPPLSVAPTNDVPGGNWNRTRTLLRLRMA
jgi:hypothetical protein